MHARARSRGCACARALTPKWPPFISPSRAEQSGHVWAGPGSRARKQPGDMHSGTAGPSAWKTPCQGWPVHARASVRMNSPAPGTSPPGGRPRAMRRRKAVDSHWEAPSAPPARMTGGPRWMLAGSISSGAPPAFRRKDGGAAAAAITRLLRRPRFCALELSLAAGTACVTDGERRAAVLG